MFTKNFIDVFHSINQNRQSVLVPGVIILSSL